MGTGTEAIRSLNISFARSHAQRPPAKSPALPQSWGACTARGAFRCAERRPAATSEAAARPAGFDALLLAALLSPCVDGTCA
jgi:hypothetical protein